MYTCPMHPDVRQEGPGKCPKCGMALVLESEVKAKPMIADTRAHHLEKLPAAHCYLLGTTCCHTRCDRRRLLAGRGISSESAYVLYGRLLLGIRRI
jgi:hypothetical protein